MCNKIEEYKKIYLTFDMDWASDEVLLWFYNLICELDIRGTLFVTNKSKALEKLHQEDKLEFGIHPNFTPYLIEGGIYEKNPVDELIKWVHGATAIRSHGLVKSSRLTKEFYEKGLRYESNTFWLPKDGMNYECWYDPWGMCQVPIIFEDDLYLMQEEKQSVNWYLGDSFCAPRVFNFHPIHLYLNTENIKRYEDYKANKSIGESAYRNFSKYGIVDFFVELVELAKKKKYKFCKIGEISGVCE